MPFLHKNLACFAAAIVLTVPVSAAAHAHKSGHARGHNHSHAAKHWTPAPPPLSAATISSFAALEESAKEKIMLVYHIAKGLLTTPEGQIIGHGHSGNGPGLNNPAMADVSNTGPTPRGRYIIGAPINSNYLGQNAMPLTPLPDTDPHGRNHFYIHFSPHKKTRGCIGLPSPSELAEIARLRRQNRALLVSVEPKKTL